MDTKRNKSLRDGLTGRGAISLPSILSNAIVAKQEAGFRWFATKRGKPGMLIW